MSISPDVCILTTAELEKIKVGAFQRGIDRGKFEALSSKIPAGGHPALEGAVVSHAPEDIGSPGGPENSATTAPAQLDAVSNDLIERLKAAHKLLEMSVQLAAGTRTTIHISRASQAATACDDAVKALTPTTVAVMPTREEAKELIEALPRYNVMLNRPGLVRDDRNGQWIERDTILAILTARGAG